MFVVKIIHLFHSSRTRQGTCVRIWRIPVHKFNYRLSIQNTFLAENYVTQIKVTYGNGGEKTVANVSTGEQCVAFAMLLAQQSNLPWMSSLWYVVNIDVKLTFGQKFTYTEFMVVEQRHLLFSTRNGTSETENSSLYVTIDPIIPLFNQVIPVKLQGNNLQCKVNFTDNLNFTLDLDKSVGWTNNCSISCTNSHFIISGDFDLSWTAADEMCASFGGHLPMITSATEGEFLEKLILGAVFQNNSKSRFKRRCRHFDPLCVFYIGLNGLLVNIPEIRF